MTNKPTWAARIAVVGLSATVLVGVTTSSAEALGSTCTPPGQRPSGPVTTALAPLFGWPGYPTSPLGEAPFAVTGLLDAVICPVLP